MLREKEPLLKEQRLRIKTITPMRAEARHISMLANVEAQTGSVK